MELAWSPASGSKQKAKHAAAEIGFLACLSSSVFCPAPNSSPAAASATNAPTQLQILVDRRRQTRASSPAEASATKATKELQILVDRRRWKMQYEYESRSSGRDIKGAFLRSRFLNVGEQSLHIDEPLCRDLMLPQFRLCAVCSFEGLIH